MTQVFTVRTAVIDGALTITIYHEQEFQGFDGEAFNAPVTIAEFDLPPDPRIAKRAGEALLNYYADRVPSDAPE